MNTCATCRHWLPKETPRWAARMQMALCATLRTKATTFAHWHTCARHKAAAAKVVAARAAWIAAADKQTSEVQP